jgi:hypothetical protein
MNSFIDLNIQPILQSFSAVKAARGKNPGEWKGEKKKPLIIFLEQLCHNIFLRTRSGGEFVSDVGKREGKSGGVSWKSGFCC